MPIAVETNPLTIDVADRNNLESGRLETFDRKWPHSDGQCSRENMSKAGFYYTGINDRVKCFVCSIKLEGWTPEEDEPWSKHLEASPSCLFAKLGKEEGQLTVEQFLDVFCSQAINKLDSKLDAVLQS